MLVRTTLAAVATLGLLLAADRTAHADVREEVEEHLHSNMRRLNDQSVDELVEYSKCRPMLAKANKKLKKTQKLRSPSFEKHPKAVQDGDTWAITVADIPWICDQIDIVVARGTLVQALDSARSYQSMLAGSPPPDERARINDGDYDLQRAKACAAGVAKEEAAGASAIEWKGTSTSIADAKALCAVLAQWGEYMNASGEANFEKVAPKYRELGVDGDRLRLFVQYENVSFRGKRCELIDDIKVLAKAKYVYQWLENADYTHTIRKYTFKGNKYKVSEKTYLTEAKAYKGCK